MKHSKLILLIGLIAAMCFANTSSFAISRSGAVGTPPSWYYRTIYYPYDFGYNWSCVPGSVAQFQWFGSYVHIYPKVFDGYYAGATWAISMTPDASDDLSVNLSELPLYAAMDGSYHVLYNMHLSGAGMEPLPGIYGFEQLSPDGLWFAHPVQIPDYGIWIYAAGERPDYPRGVMVLTLDPNNNPYAAPAPDAWSGRCDSRRQFIIPL